MKLKLGYLESLKPSYIKKGYHIPKWIEFSEELIKDGWKINLYRSQTTVSKYLYVSKGKLSYKIRFSNHKPNKEKELENDADFYVGVFNRGSLTTEALLEKLKKENQDGVYGNRNNAL